MLPGGTIRAVVLPYGPPGSFAEIGAPALPMAGALVGFFQSTLFVSHGVSFLARPQR
jgi:hypothetical protein